MRYLATAALCLAVLWAAALPGCRSAPHKQTTASKQDKHAGGPVVQRRVAHVMEPLPENTFRALCARHIREARAMYGNDRSDRDYDAMRTSCMFHASLFPPGADRAAGEKAYVDFVMQHCGHLHEKEWIACYHEFFMQAHDVLERTYKSKHDSGPPGE